MQSGTPEKSIEIPLDTRVAKWKSYSWILIIFGMIIYFILGPVATYMAATSASIGNIGSIVAIVVLVQGLGCLMLTGGFLFSALYYNEDRKTKESKGESTTWAWFNLIFAVILVAWGAVSIIRILLVSVFMLTI